MQKLISILKQKSNTTVHLEKALSDLLQHSPNYDIVICLDIKDSDNKGFAQQTTRSIVQRASLTGDKTGNRVAITSEPKIEELSYSCATAMMATIKVPIPGKKESSLGDFLITASAIFDSNPSSAQKLIIIISDFGIYPNDNLVQTAHSKMFMDKITIMSISLKHPKDILENIASPDLSFCIEKYEALASVFTQQGANPYQRPTVLVERTYTTSMELHISSNMKNISKFTIDLFCPQTDKDYHVEVASIVVPDPNNVDIVYELKNLQPNSEYYIRVKTLGLDLPVVIVKDKTLKDTDKTRLFKNIAKVKEENNRLANHIQTYRVPSEVAKNHGLEMVNQILFGKIGTGKSSFINTLFAALSGSYEPICLTDASGDKSVTRKLEYIELPESKIRIHDTWGYQTDNYDETQFNHIVRGEYRDGISELDSNTHVIKQQYGWNDHMHGAILAISATAIDNPKELARFRLFNSRLVALGIQSVVAVTKLDLLDAKLQSSPEYMFDSDIVQMAITQLSQQTGISPVMIFPVLSYLGTYENRDPIREYLALSPIVSALQSSSAFYRKIANEKPRPSHSSTPISPPTSPVLSGPNAIPKIQMTLKKVNQKGSGVSAICPPTLDELLAIASKKLGIKAVAIYLESGGRVTEIEDITAAEITKHVYFAATAEEFEALEH